ncbi:MAG: hypothetical protein AAGJ86_01660 [Pseudomonadota bacterium]
MKTPRTLALFALCLLAQLALADSPRVTHADLAILDGAPWIGSLNYLDYSSGEVEQIPVTIQFDKPGKRKVIYRIKYPGESQYNSREKLKISADGAKLNGEPIVSRTDLEDGTIVVVTEHRDKDDGRPADIRMTYSLHAARLEIRKEVRFASDSAYFERNAYRLTR